ncbi:hypothetical protein FNYG_09855 [Fusarium nygamai]|nr:hypothetical protein FNYG_09855 [Fusarium nygamai]
MRSQTRGDAADARRAKKREVDRRAQQLMRERTKKRIAQLEATVDILRQDNSNAKIMSLMDELAQVTEERDNLLQALDSMNDIIRLHLREYSASKPSSGARSEALSYTSTHKPLNHTHTEPITSIMTQSTPEYSERTETTLPAEPQNSQPQHIIDTFSCETWNSAA